MLIEFFLWFYLIIKIYCITSKQALKVTVILFIVGLITSPLISLIFPYSYPFQSHSIENLSCEERYSTFPLGSLSEEQKREGLQTCLTNQAIDESNPLLCQKITSPDNCYSRYASEKKDSTICAYLIEQNQYSCYYNLAKKTGDATICNDIPNGSIFDASSCKFNVNMFVEVLKGNINYCESITIDWRKDYCYITFAKAKLDTSICNKIEHEEYNSIQSCIDEVNKWKERQKEIKTLPEYYWA
jgi:hypothetical protein